LLESQLSAAYKPAMDTIPDKTPATWQEILEESEAELAAGQIISGEQVMRDLKDALARLESKPLLFDPKPGM